MNFDFRSLYSPSTSLLVTGATGYIGNQVIRDSGLHDFEPIAFDKTPEGAVIIHCASDLSGTRESFIGNIDRDSWLVEEVNAKHKGLVFASTNNVYGYGEDCKINDLTQCNDFYSASKIFSEKLIQDKLKVPYSIIRIADTFGPGQHHGNFFKAVECSIKKQTALKLYGEGLKIRSYIYIFELSSFLLFQANNLLQNNNIPTLINACYSDALSVYEIVQYVSQLTALPIEKIDVPNDLSSQDLRIMKSGPFGEYKLKWSTAILALKDYINHCCSINKRE